MHFKAASMFNRTFSLAILLVLIGFVFFTGHYSNGHAQSFDDSNLAASTNVDSSNRIITIEGNGFAFSSYDFESLLSTVTTVNFNSIVINQAPGIIIENLDLVGVNITLIDSPDSVIRDNTITGITGDFVYGIYVENSPNTIIEGNKISDLNGISKAYGIYGINSPNLVIENNDISFVLTPDGITNGIFVDGAGDGHINNNRIFDLSGSVVFGIESRLNDGETFIISNSIFQLSGEAISGVFTFGTNNDFVENNNVSNLQTLASGQYIFGIAPFSNEASIVSNNIDGINVIGSSATNAIGIATNSQKFVITDNNVTNVHVESTTGDTLSVGIWGEFGIIAGSLVAHNTVNTITGTSPIDSVSFGMIIYKSKNFNVEFNSITNIQYTAPTGNGIEIFQTENDLSNYDFVVGKTNDIYWSDETLTLYDQYYLYQDNVVIDQNMWSDGDRYTSTKIRIPTNLQIGQYTFTVLVLDNNNGGLPVTDTVIVNILPAFVPQLLVSFSSDIELGTTGNTVEWEFVDNNPDYYVIYENSVLTVNATWTSEVPIVYNVDHLTSGDYNITIFAIDQEGNVGSSTVLFSVFDSEAPVISVLFEKIVEQENPISNITWHLSDVKPGSFRIFANHTEVSNGTWENNIPVVFDLYGWDLGETNFTLEVNDASGLISRDTIFIVIMDNIEPYLNEPFDFFFNEGDAGVTLEWIAEDFNPGNWTLFENEFNYQNGTWESEVPIVINLDEYKVGRYNFTIYVYDAFNNTVIDTVIVNVFLPTDSTYTRNTETQTKDDGNIFKDVNPVYIAAGGVVIGLATIGSILRRRRGF